MVHRFYDLRFTICIDVDGLDDGRWSDVRWSQSQWSIGQSQVIFGQSHIFCILLFQLWLEPVRCMKFLNDLTKLVVFDSDCFGGTGGSSPCSFLAPFAAPITASSTGAALAAAAEPFMSPASSSIIRVLARDDNRLRIELTSDLNYAKRGNAIDR